MHQSSEKGLSLVELAISLMVIGLLVGIVLKGQELYENTKLTHIMKQFKAYQAATVAFESTYEVMPGDMTKPNKRIVNCNFSPCNTPGNGDGFVSPSTNWNFLPFASIATGEYRNFWLHLAVAGYIEGVDSTGKTSSPFQFGVEVPAIPMEESGMSSFSYTSPYIVGTKNIIAVTGKARPPLSANQAFLLDFKNDDGMPFSGDIIADTSFCTVDTSATSRYKENDLSATCYIGYLYK